MRLLAAALTTLSLLGLLLWRVFLGFRQESSPHISLCLLVRDEVERVEGRLAGLLALAERLGPCVTDVVLLDEGSTDGTADVVRALGRRHPGLKVVCWPVDAPGRTALEAAHQACAGSWVLLARAGDAPLHWDARALSGAMVRGTESWSGPST